MVKPVRVLPVVDDSGRIVHRYLSRPNTVYEFRLFPSSIEPKTRVVSAWLTPDQGSRTVLFDGEWTIAIELP